LEDEGVDGRLILKRISYKEDGKMLAGFNWLTIRTRGFF
jgi:hypothetical protein